MTTRETRQTLIESGVSPLWDSPTTAAYLGVPPATLDQWAYRGVGPAYSKVGRHRRYRSIDVDVFVDAHRRGGDSA